jgi:hypothetical protein
MRIDRNHKEQNEMTTNDEQIQATEQALETTNPTEPIEAEATEIETEKTAKGKEVKSAETDTTTPKAGRRKAIKKEDSTTSTEAKKPGKKGPKEGLTVAELTDRYIEHLEESHKSHGTIFSYGMELKLALAELGAETKIASLTPKKVQAFYESDRVTKTKKGRQKSKLSIDKTRRVLRMALEWAAAEGLIETAPIPKSENA